MVYREEIFFVNINLSISIIYSNKYNHVENVCIHVQCNMYFYICDLQFRLFFISAKKRCRGISHML